MSDVEHPGALGEPSPTDRLIEQRGREKVFMLILMMIEDMNAGGRATKF